VAEEKTATVYESARATVQESAPELAESLATIEVAAKALASAARVGWLRGAVAVAESDPRSVRGLVLRICEASVTALALAESLRVAYELDPYEDVAELRTDTSRRPPPKSN